MKIKISQLLEAAQKGEDIKVYSRRLPDGRMILCATPDFSKRKLSNKQKEHQAKFKEAVAYARAAQTQSIYIELAAGTMNNAYNVALSDWFHTPEIKEIDISAWSGDVGQVIRIRAEDDVQVTQVNVVITDGTGTVLEQGQATVTADAMWWSYTTTASAGDGAKITVTARDLPGHIAEMIWD